MFEPPSGFYRIYYSTGDSKEQYVSFMSAGQFMRRRSNSSSKVDISPSVSLRSTLPRQREVSVDMIIELLLKGAPIGALAV
jgi:hypothetical protein